MTKYRIVEAVHRKGSTVWVEEFREYGFWDRFLLPLPHKKWVVVKDHLSSVNDAKHWIDQRVTVKFSITEYP